MIDPAYRAYSPSRNHTALITGDLGHAQGRVGALNQLASTGDACPDWTVQVAAPQWADLDPAWHSPWNTAHTSRLAYLEAVVEAEEFMGGPATT